MKTTQSTVARLESGRSRPSTRTLARFAKATGHRLRISFQPLKGKGEELCVRMNRFANKRFGANSNVDISSILSIILRTKGNTGVLVLFSETV